MICRIVCSARHEQRGDCFIPHLYSKLLHLPCSVLALFKADHTFRGRPKPSILASGFSINETLRTPEYLHHVLNVSIKASDGNVKSHIGCLYLSLFWGCILISLYSGRFGFLFILSIVRSAYISLRKFDGVTFARTSSHYIRDDLTVPDIIRTI